MRKHLGPKKRTRTVAALKESVRSPTSTPSPSPLRSSVPFLAASPLFGPSGDPDKDAHKWRKLSGRSSMFLRDLPEVKREAILQIVFFMYLSNPLARRIVNIYVDFTLGDGVKLAAKNPKLLRVLNEFWKDPDNRMDSWGGDLVREESLYGELFLPVFENELTGKHKIGYIDPQIVPSGGVEANPENVKEIVKIKTRDTVSGLTVTAGSYSANLAIGSGREYDPVRMREFEIQTLADGTTPVIRRAVKPYLYGDMHFFRINSVTNQLRGTSDLSHIADWLDSFDFFLFSMMDRADLMNRWVWDIEIQGASPDEVKEFLRNFGTPKPGEARCHNERVKISAVNPDMKAADWTEAVRAFRQMILAGAGFPEHWFSEPSRTNRASSVEAGMPTIRMLESRQRHVIEMFRQMLNYQLERIIRRQPTLFSSQEQANQRGELDFTLDVPKINARDAEQTANVLSQLSTAMLASVTAGLISPRLASQALLLYIRDLGIDTEAEEKRIREEVAAEAKRLEQTGPDGAATRLPPITVPASQVRIPVPAIARPKEGDLLTGGRDYGPASGNGNGNGNGDRDRERDLADRFNDAIHRSFSRQKL